MDLEQKYLKNTYEKCFKSHGGSFFLILRVLRILIKAHTGRLLFLLLHYWNIEAVELTNMYSMVELHPNDTTLIPHKSKTAPCTLNLAKCLCYTVITLLYIIYSK